MIRPPWHRIFFYARVLLSWIPSRVCPPLFNHNSQLISACRPRNHAGKSEIRSGQVKVAHSHVWWLTVCKRRIQHDVCNNTLPNFRDFAMLHQVRCELQDVVGQHHSPLLSQRSLEAYFRGLFRWLLRCGGRTGRRFRCRNLLWRLLCICSSASCPCTWRVRLWIFGHELERVRCCFRHRAKGCKVRESLKFAA